MKMKVVINLSGRGVCVPDNTNKNKAVKACRETLCLVKGDAQNTIVMSKEHFIALVMGTPKR